jgi:formylglycine-generating enzyme
VTSSVGRNLLTCSFVGPRLEHDPLSSRIPVVLSTPPPAPASTPRRARLVSFSVAALAIAATTHVLASRPTFGAATLDVAGPAAAAARLAAIADVLDLSPCPDEMALVDHGGLRVCVDRWENSVVEKMANGEERLWSPYTPPAFDRNLVAVSRPDAVPQGYVSKKQAEHVCGAAGKRLCTSQEWVTACRGPVETIYPYGPVERPNACNTHGASPLRKLFGGTKGSYSLGPMNHPLLNRLPGTVAKTGTFAACTNGWGIYDMVGNLHEWTADESGVFRGGYYLDTKINGLGCGYATTAHAPSYHDYSTGFRCCRDAG